MSDRDVLPLRSIKDRCSPAEWKMRVDLAACYRLVEHYDALREKYARAADRPWWFVGPDAPEPQWPKDVPRP